LERGNRRRNSQRQSWLAMDVTLQSHGFCLPASLVLSLTLKLTMAPCVTSWERKWTIAARASGPLFQLIAAARRRAIQPHPSSK
jgi:hypothetical protein